jgi:hypothetical protein
MIIESPAIVSIRFGNSAASGGTQKTAPTEAIRSGRRGFSEVGSRLRYDPRINHSV